VRVGISGVPGVGKSTLIDALGIQLIDAGHRVAVLAVDPSSTVSGGSILGDKSRMSRLSRTPEAFVRPSPSATTLGGVARRTREAMTVCEAAGFDVVLVETVGVGQVEVEVAGKADTTVVVVNPGWGDSVQANKAGLMEIADVFVINKADREGANDTRRDLELMLDLSHVSGHEDGTGYRPPILMTTATDGSGIEAMWEAVTAHRTHLEATGSLERRRAARFRYEVASRLTTRMERSIARSVDGLNPDGRSPATVAADLAADLLA